MTHDERMAIRSRDTMAVLVTLQTECYGDIGVCQLQTWREWEAQADAVCLTVVVFGSITTDRHRQSVADG